MSRSVSPRLAPHHQSNANTHWSSVNQRRKLRFCNWGELNTQAIATTSMIYRENRTTLTTEKLLDEMYIQWRLAGGKMKEDKDSNDDNEIALAATNTKKGGKKPNGRCKPK
jgi:hypothetical protein